MFIQKKWCLCLIIFMIVSKISASDELYEKTLCIGSNTHKLVFRKVSYDRPLVTQFPLEQLEEHPLVHSFTKAPIPQMQKTENLLEMYNPIDNVVQHVTFRYAIHQSIEDAEDDIMERVVYPPIVETFDSEGRVGDNCWYFEGWGHITFVRNNVVIYCYTGCSTSNEGLLTIASTLDTLLVHTQKSTNRDELPLPQIMNVNFGKEVSDPDVPGRFVRAITLQATDPLDGELWYAKQGGLFWFTETNSRNTLSLGYNKNVDNTKRKIWVANDSFYVSSIVVDFSPPPR